MTQNNWYWIRIIGIVIALATWFIVNKLSGSLIGLHPPEIDMICENIVDEYNELKHQIGSQELQVEQTEKKEIESQLKEEESLSDDDVDYNYWQQWRYGGGFIKWI